jgi:Ca2+/Na+ antiporter
MIQTLSFKKLLALPVLAAVLATFPFLFVTVLCSLSALTGIFIVICITDRIRKTEYRKKTGLIIAALYIVLILTLLFMQAFKFMA